MQYERNLPFCILVLHVVSFAYKIHVPCLQVRIPVTEDKSFTFRIPEALLERLQQLAADEDLSVAQLVLKALREFLEGVSHGQK